VADARAKIAAEPRNLNYFRGLARLYLQQKRFADAIQVFEEARVINPADPELDRNLAQAKIQQYAANVADLRAKGQAAAADQLEAECTQFVFSDLISRVERYPNDLRLRYELGLQYFEGGQIDEAIQQFQIAQRSPKERGDALYYLARCFRAKGQMDMAIMQLETAAEQLPVMDDNRKKVLFELGEICELSGKPDRAFSCFKEVYGADIGYRDIGQKMERFYKARPPQT
jgi:tetratricopeptide (TPR) repeat protein